MLEALKLTVVRGDRPVFIGLDLRLAPGQALHVAGPNGSGKSTLLRVLAGLLSAESGSLRRNGVPGALGRAMPDVAYLGHRNGLKGELTALENLATIAALYGYGADRERLRSALAQVGLPEVADTAVGLLSQGQQRRVALARVLISRAGLWLLDEPTTALDQASVSTFEAVCTEHLRAGGMLVFANHTPLQLPTERLQLLEMLALRHSMEEEPVWLVPSII